jgi:hypothetical protein
MEKSDWSGSPVWKAQGMKIEYETEKEEVIQHAI